MFRGYIFGPRKQPTNKDKAQFSPPEWAAFNRALYQHRPRVAH